MVSCLYPQIYEIYPEIKLLNLSRKMYNLQLSGNYFQFIQLRRTYSSFTKPKIETLARYV